MSNRSGLNLNNGDLVRKLKVLQAKVGGIKDDMRNYHDKQQQELTAVTDQISLILSDLVANSAEPIINNRSSNSTNNSQISNGNGIGSYFSVGSSSGVKREGTTYDAQSTAKRTKQDDGGFQVNNDGFTEVHTDGACPNNGKETARAGIGVWWGPNHPLNLSKPVVGDRHTNNTAEIQAAHFAIGQAQGAGIDKLIINTDSQFLINCVTKWMPGWKRNGWRTTSKQPVKNKEDLEALDEALANKSIEIKWNHVRGHSGIYGNEQADKLAVAGANK